MGETISERIKKQLMDVSCEAMLYHKLREHLLKCKKFDERETTMILDSMILSEEV